MLTTDGESGSDEAGTRQKEGGVDAKDVEHGDQHADPQDDGEEMVDHACGGIGSLLATALPDLGGLELPVTRPGAPPTGGMGDAPLRDSAHDSSNREVRESRDDHRSDHDHDDPKWSRHDLAGRRLVGRGRESGEQ